MPYEERLQGEYGRLLREASAHFEGQSGVYRTLLNLARRLDGEGIPYAVVGGMALGKYGYARMTEDVDVLMTASPSRWLFPIPGKRRLKLKVSASSRWKS